ncbi:LexA family transcriptional regulator [Flavobacterium sp.]|uniref:XRE family transcriptional regulator n=1 Tax=Flavobacterium sp. TaxID=239 RepID=UPI002B4AEAC5|nr:LexA family transcriptional regulator [Flavobacterium sp.]
MSLFSDNIKLLRAKKEISQREVAESLHISRDRYAKYEDGKNSPPPEILLVISRYFHISIDILLSIDLKKIPMGDLLKLGDNRILLPITVDRNGNNFIEIVPHKAKAGYLTGYADPEFIESLQHISLPFLGQGKHRAFPVEGDSMPPHEDGSFIVGRYIEKLGEVMDGKTYILITKTEGIVYKRLNKNGKNDLMAHSDNSYYPPYPVKASEVLEIWEYECNIGRNDRKQELSDVDTVRDMFLELKKEINDLKK